MTIPGRGSKVATAPSAGYSSRSASRERAGLTTPGRVVVTSTSCATPRHATSGSVPVTLAMSGLSRDAYPARQRRVQGVLVNDRTVRLEVPSDESDPASYLRAAWRTAVEQGAERVELVVGTSDGHLRHAAHRAGFLHEGVLRKGRATPYGPEDVHLYAIVAGDDHEGPAGFSYVMNAALPRTRVIAHALFRDTDDRVLLLQVSYKSDWELPGGIVDRHEPPRRRRVSAPRRRR